MAMQQSTPEDSLELDRRELLRLLAASLALAGASGCSRSPHEKILPYVQRPREAAPGVPTEYATSMVIDGFAMGLLVQSHEGRPTKIEGNPEHPASLGATGVYQQASLLDLYDPGRVVAVRRDGALASWSDALAALQHPPTWRPWFVLPPQSSPLLGTWIERVLARYPAARFTFVSPISRQRVYEATQLLLGRPLEPQYDVGRARVILSLGADFLEAMPMSVRWAREFARRRRGAPAEEMNRLYAVETMLSPTGSVADHRAAVRASEIPAIAGAILREVMSQAGAQPAARLPAALLASLPQAADTPVAPFVQAVARDLWQARGAALVVAGDGSPLEVQLIAHALNSALDSWGDVAWFVEPALLTGNATLTALAEALDARAVDAVLVLDSNPVYWAPPVLELGRRLRSAPESFHLTHSDNETSRACRWVMPLSHYLESWGDARAHEGTASFIQPLIEPLHPSRSALELLAACGGQPGTRGHELLVERYRDEFGANFDAAFEEGLRAGLIADSASPRLTPRADFTRAVEALRSAPRPPQSTPELHFETSPALYDGRFASNAWLLELPHPMTKQTWGNAAVIGTELAAELGISNGRVLELEVDGRKLAAPALILPGHARDAVTLALGFGQSGTNLVGAGVGANAYLLRNDDQLYAPGLRIAVSEREHPLAITQDHANTRGRSLALIATLGEYRERPELTAALRGPQPTLLPMFSSPQGGAGQGFPNGGRQWAMTIDTSICTGCSACVIACQAENNVPVVGERNVRRGREMHWLRIDRYFEGPDEAPRVVHQPMMCQHCEAAPCEYVCPVNATVHSPDGLNEMVYNRCVGTRFCSNNCPYKVRRFNWFDFNREPSVADLAHNPDVTVRERGVMEKCTYCVQRIRRAEMKARIEKREIGPGEVVTACQQACPTEAIQFGSLDHAGTKMVEWRNEGRAYAVLHDLGTRPRTQYLAKIQNPNPEIERG
jgi:molybdopterin-containing oxidoreductase family iron-sulfur binding subunit